MTEWGCCEGLESADWDFCPQHCGSPGPMGDLYGGDNEKQVGTIGRGDTAETSPLFPNLTNHPTLLLFSPNYPRRPRSNASSSRKVSKIPLVRLTCFFSHLFPATPPSIIALTHLHFPFPDSDVPASPHSAAGPVLERSPAQSATLLTGLSALPGKSGLSMWQAGPQAAWSYEQHVGFQKQNSKKEKKKGSN